MSWDKIVYAGLCVIVPVAWGLIVYAVSSRIEKRVLPGRKVPGTSAGDDETTLPLDYHI